MLRESLDREVRQDGLLSSRDAHGKLVCALVIIAVVLVTPSTLWPAHVLVVGLLIVGYAASRLPWQYLARRLLVALPMVTLVALGVPLSHGLTTGWGRMVTIIVKATLCLSAVWLLVGTTSDAELLRALRRLRVPGVLVAVLFLMVRYFVIVREELARMLRAKQSRTPGHAFADWRILPNLVGRLFLRSLDRAERVHQAMLARGWNGESPK